MNWGKSITVAIVLFMAYILYFVFKMIAYDVDLVAEDYYVQELAFQEQINRVKNSKKNNIESSVRFENDSLIILFSNAEGFNSGTINFYRPSNPNFDVSFPINLGEQSSSYKLPVNSLKSGKYIAKMDFLINDLPCYTENIIVVP